jgi:hypothetical protein
MAPEAAKKTNTVEHKKKARGMPVARHREVI